MNYTQLINRVLEKLQLAEHDTATINIHIPTRTVTIITTWFAKFVAPFPAEESDDINQDPEPRPKRIKAVKRTG